MRLSVAAAFAAVFVLLLGGCKEPGRPLSYEKGVYGGKADQSLSAEQLQALHQRANEQRF